MLNAISLGMSAMGAGPVDTSFRYTAAAKLENQRDIVGATGSNPSVTLELGSITKVRVIVAVVVGNSVQLKLTSAAGTDQLVPLSAGGLFMMFLPTLGDELTAIKVVGDGSTVSYIVAGDTD
jgi:hypothetical protein